MTNSNRLSDSDSRARLEWVAAFIDGTLSPEEREQLLALLADDDDTYEMFVGAIDYLRSEAELAAARRGKRRMVAVLAATVVMAAALLFVIARALH